jgi:hypothetical protein
VTPVILTVFGEPHLCNAKQNIKKMATHTIQTATVRTQSQISFPAINLIKRFTAFADSQQKWAMAYWICSLMLIGGFFVPVTFLTVYSLGGPVIPYLALSMISFFISLIANMGGMSIRACLFTFFLSIILHLLMILSTVIGYIIFT